MKQKWNLILIWLLSISILVSSINVVSTLATQPYTVTQEQCYDSGVDANYTALTNTYGTNLLSGLSVYSKKTSESDYAVQSGWSNLTDENANGSSSNVNINAGDYPQLYFKLNKLTELKQITVYNYVSWGTNLELKSFDIYVSDSASTLWNSENLVVDYDVTANTSTMSNNILKFEFNSGAEPIGQYVGIKWNSPYNFRDGSNGVVLSEIAAFGEEAKDYTVTQEQCYDSGVDANYTALTDAYGENLLSGLPVYSKLTTAGNFSVQSGWSNLTDENANGSSSNVNISAENYPQLYFKLNRMTTLKQITVYNYISWGTNLELRSFDIYVSESASTLFDDSNRVIDYDVEVNTATMSNNVLKFEFTEGNEPTGSVIGIKWNSPYNFRDGSSGVVLSEIAAFGEESGDILEPYTVMNENCYDSGVAATYTALTDKYGENLLSGLPVYSKKAAETEFIAQPDWANVTDEDVNGTTSNVNINSADYPQWYFKLQLPTELKQITVYNYISWGTNLELRSFDIYVSDSASTLWNSENLVVDYDVDVNTATMSNNVIKFEFTEGARPIGQYIGIKWNAPCNFRITDGVQSTGVVLSEIAAFGREIEVAESVTTAAKAKEEYNAVNLLKTAKYRTNISDLNVTALSDGNYSTSVDVGSGTITYILDNEYAIKNLALIMPDNERIADYQVFLSKDADELFTDENMVADYTTNENGITDDVAVNLVRLRSVTNARYVGFKFNSGSAAVKVNELVAIGDELPEYTVTTEIQPNTDARQFVAEKFGNNRLLNATLEYANTHSSFGYESAKCADDDYEAFYFERSGGNPKLTYTLRSNILVKDFAISSCGNPYGEGKIRLGEYKLYLSTDKDNLYSESNCVAHVVGQQHTTLAYSSVIDMIELRDAVEAKYVGIEIIKDNLSSKYVGIRTNEFAVFGTPLSATIDSTTEFLQSLKNGLINSNGKNDKSLGKAVSTEDEGIDYNGGLNTATFNKLNEIYLNKNILSGLTAEVTAKEGYTVYSDKGDASLLTDGVIDSDKTYSLQVKNGNSDVVSFNDSYVYLTYDLGTSRNLELLTIAGSRDSKYQQYKYKVYVSNDKDTLYSADNLVKVYDLNYSTLSAEKALDYNIYAAKADEVSGYDPLIAQYMIMSGNSGRYVGIAIADAADDQNKVCLGEIALWASRDAYVAEYDSYGLYAEEVFNVIENGDFEDEISDENWGSLNKGFKIVKASGETHGSKALRVTAGKTQTWHFELKANTEYTISFYASSVNGKAKITAACDDEFTQFDNVISNSIVGSYKNCAITTSNTDGSWKRLGFTFYSGEDTDLYLTIEGISGETLLDDVMLFRSKYCKDTDINDYTVSYTGYVSGVPVVDAETGIITYEDLRK